MRSLFRLQQRALRDASRVVVLGRCMRQHLEDHYGVAAEKVEVIPNWHTVASPVQEDPKTPSAPFQVVYTGNVGRSQDFETILAAAERLKPEDDLLFRIVGVGAQADWLRDQIRSRALGNVVIDAFLPDGAFQDLLASADLGVVSLAANMTALSVPSKLYNFLAMGVPVLAVCDQRSEVARVVLEEQVGYHVVNGDARGLAECILDACERPEKRSDMARRAKSFATSTTSLDAVCQRYAEVLLSV